VASEAASAVRAALRLLPDSQRRVVELAYFAGLTCREVAAAAGIPEGTAKSRLRLALAKLETMLDRQEWRHAAGRTLDLVRTAGGRGEVAIHGMRLPLDALLVVRAFEVWTHDNDIRRAAGWPASVPDASTMRLMCELAARLLPDAAARAGLRQAASVRLVLTGPGGGTWDVAVGAGGPGPAAARIVTGAAGFCPLSSARTSPGTAASRPGC